MGDLTDNPYFSRPKPTRYVVSVDPGAHVPLEAHKVEQALQEVAQERLRSLLRAHELRVEVDELSTPPLGSTMKWRMGEWRWTIEPFDEAA